MPAKKQVTRDMILDSALRLLKEQGYDAVNIRQLSRALRCSTQPVYLSFSGMEELRNALIPLAALEFENFMKAESADGEIRLYDMGYLLFAKTEPHLFCFLFMRANAFFETKKILLPIIERSVAELAEAHCLDHGEADLLHDHLWMHAHGIASMIATDFCDWDMAKVSRMLERCKHAFLKKYEK